MSPRDTMIVDAPCGPVQGICRPTSHPGSDSWAFYGLPFAQPPTGPLRFLAPRRRSPWEQPIDATRPGATAQRHALLDVTTIPEPSIAGDDTLLVNVFTPHPGRTDARAPVMVWIHGGGYVAGSPSSPWYDGNAFNRDGIVTVSVSYRLGFDGFGWVDGSDAPTNRALLDLIMALTWVRDNIASFGGDPDNVTVAGHSAGAACIHALMASGQAEGLFHAAICQSPLPITLTVDDSHVTAVHMALAAGIPATLDGWCSLSEETIYSAQQHLIIALGETAQMQVDADGCNPLTIECPPIRRTLERLARPSPDPEPSDQHRAARPRPASSLPAVQGRGWRCYLALLFSMAVAASTLPALLRSAVLIRCAPQSRSSDRVGTLPH